MEITKEERDNVAKLSAYASVITQYMQGCKTVIEVVNKESLRKKYFYHTLSSANKKYIDKKIAKELFALTRTMNTALVSMEVIENSMRDVVGDEIVDNLIDMIEASMKDVSFDSLLNKDK